MFLVAANTRQAIVGQKEWITTGSSGIQVQFLFSSDWDGLSKFAVFRNAEIEESVIPIALPASGLTELPAENCDAEYVDEKVYVGVYGTDGLGHIIIPTIWVSLGVLKEGAAYEGMDPPQPTPDMWAQILAIAQNAGAENAAAAEQSAEEAEASKEAIQDMNVQAETLPDESPLTVTKEVDPETGAVTLIFGLTRGPKGNKGDDGYSPTITITPIQGGHRFTVTDKDHPTGQSFDVMNGAPGAPGSPGAPGAPGDPGYSPEVTITTITGGHRVTITDEDHPTGQSFDVMDGASDAGQVSYDPTQTYQSGTVGKELSDQKNAIDQKAPVIINSASGDIASFADGADGGKIKKLVGTIVTSEGGSGWTGANLYNASILPNSGLTYNIRPKQAGTGTPSPTNERNITPGLSFLRDDATQIDVYRGSLTFHTDGTSTLVKNYGIKVFNGTETFTEWFHQTDRVAETNAIQNASHASGTSGYCNRYEIRTVGANLRAAGNYTCAFGSTRTQRLFYVRDSRFATLGEFSAGCAGLQVVYPLYSPVTYELSVTETERAFSALGGSIRGLAVNWQDTAGTILNGTVTLNDDGSADIINSDTGDIYHLTDVGRLTTLYGVNNVWIDTGSITECDYPADTKLYIDGLTEPDEDMIANANIASGKYFVVNNQLYLSTAAIATGASIVPGTNCTATNLAEALNAINT